MRTDEHAAADVVDRARAWFRATHTSVCDVVEPWPHGTILRAARYPTFYEYNQVWVQDEPAMTVAELTVVADDALAGLAHRLIAFHRGAAAEPLRAEFERDGWRAMKLLWLRHEGPPPPPDPRATVEHVPYDAVHHLRVAWHEEDFPGIDASEYFAASREVSMTRRARVLAAHSDGMPVGFAQVEQLADAAEVTHVYVLPAHRGKGLGTALTTAAIAAASDVADLWICADDEYHAKDLYQRLGFQPVCTTMDFLLLPASKND